MRTLFSSRITIVLAALVAGQFAVAQKGVWDTAFQTAMDAADVASGKSVFQVSKPDIVVQVSKHHFGADMFEVAAVDPEYPPELLQSQLIRLGDILGVHVRGLIVGKAPIGGDRNRTATKATFATDGVIDRERGILRIGPIVQAFAGAPEPHTVHGLMVSFNGESVTPNMLRSYASPAVRLQAIANQNPPAVEYRIQLLSQDPNQIQVPEGPANAPHEQTATPTTSTGGRGGVDWGLWVPLLLAGVAAAVLVYFGMMRAMAKPRR